MYNPTLRLLTILELLQAREAISGVELAERLEVDPRSVRRYVTMLQDLGIPVESVRGRYGSYRLRPGYTLPPLMLNNEEAVAVTLGLLAIETQGFSFAAPSVVGAIAKITRVLPVTLQERIKALKQVVIFGSNTRSPILTLNGEVMLVIAEGISTHHQLLLRYCTENGEQTERTVAPYGVAFWSGRWYLAGYCHLRQAIRAFRLDRVRQVRLDTQSYDLPLDFDCIEYLAHSFGRFVHQWEVEVRLKTSLKEAQASIPAMYGTIEAGLDEVVYRCQVESLLDAARFLVELRVPFVVVKPNELKTALRELAKEISHYADTEYQP